MGQLGTYNSVLQARRRALCTLTLFAVGIYIGLRFMSLGAPITSTLVLGCGGAVVSICVFGPSRWRSVLLALAVLMLGCGWSMLRLNPDHPTRLDSVITKLDPQLSSSLSTVPIEIRGVVSEPSRVAFRVQGLADPPMWDDMQNQAQMQISAVLVHEPNAIREWQRASGTVRVLLPEGTSLEGGARLEVLGMYTQPGQRRNPGEPDWSLLSAQRGHAGTLMVEHYEHIKSLPAGSLLSRASSLWLKLRGIIRDRALRSIGIDETKASDEGTAIRAALLLGERDPRFDEIFTAFQRVGVAHVLAISGFHLALVILMLSIVVRLIGEYPKLNTTLILFALLGVVVLIPLRPPIVRASVIVGAMVLAQAAGRRYDRMTILAWVGVGLLVWRPLDITSLGYQLSMGITALLVAISDEQSRAVIDRQISPVDQNLIPTRFTRTLRWAWGVLKVNFACWAVALPIVMYHAGVVGTLAPIVSVLLVPLIALQMALGYVQILIGIIVPDIASHTIELVDIPSGIMFNVMDWTHQLGWSWLTVPKLSAPWTIVSTFVLAMISVGRWRWYRPRVIACIGVLAMWGFAHPILNTPRSVVRTTMLDVSDGTCIVVQSGQQAIVWDCGSLFRRIGKPVALALREMGVTRLEGVVITHDNIDHFNGLPDLAEHFSIPRVYITPRLDRQPSGSWKRVRAHLESRSIPIEVIAEDDVILLGDERLEFIWPPSETSPTLDDNDTSLVAMIQTQIGTVLLTGDIEGPAMLRIKRLYPDLPEQFNQGVIELPHHGSARDEAYRFIDWLDPCVVLQSTGPMRLDDERWDAQRVGRDWYTTAQGGAVVHELHRDGQIEYGYWYGRE